MKILVVDDDPDYRRAAEMALRLLGHEMCWSGNGEDALVSLRTEKPDLLLLDLDLGRGRTTGRDVLAEKLVDPELRKIPVVIVTGKHPGEVREQERVVAEAFAGDMLILPKPLDLAELEVILAHFAGGKPAM